jgi:hypothetical protein
MIVLSPNEKTRRTVEQKANLMSASAFFSAQSSRKANPDRQKAAESGLV